MCRDCTLIPKDLDSAFVAELVCDSLLCNDYIELQLAQMYLLDTFSVVQAHC